MVVNGTMQMIVLSSCFNLVSRPKMQARGLGGSISIDKVRKWSSEGAPGRSSEALVSINAWQVIPLHSERRNRNDETRMIKYDYYKWLKQ